MKRFDHAIMDFNPDLIHVFAIHVHLTPSILEAAKKRGKPVVMSCNDYKHICPNYKLYDGENICEVCKDGNYYHAVMKRCCKGSFVFSLASAIEAYVHSSKSVYDRLVDRYLFASNFMLDKTREFWFDKEVGYGKLMNPFNANEYEPHYSGEFALYFGRIIGEKGVDRIVDAAERVSIPIKIVGDGPDHEELSRRCKQGNLKHIEFLGPCWGEELKRVLYASRYVIVPSLWHENFPYVIFQAFAAGKPVLGTNRGGIPELVGDRRGILFDPDDVSSMSEKMSQLWQDESASQSMGQEARQYVIERFSDEAFYSDLMANYREVLQ
jgi:glycosyltransferase involved in cell wall biosynthesis